MFFQIGIAIEVVFQDKLPAVSPAHLRVEMSTRKITDKRHKVGRGIFLIQTGNGGSQLLDFLCRQEPDLFAKEPIILQSPDIEFVNISVSIKSFRGSNTESEQQHLKLVEKYLTG